MSGISSLRQVASKDAGRNLLHNGAMQVAQRGTSSAGIAASGGYFTADRWYFNTAVGATWTQSVENDAPTGSGFRKSLKLLVTSADASPAATVFRYAEQLLEGQDLQRIAKGTASAQQLTISFWVKSNVTGTYVVMLYDGNNTRHVAATYTVSASATWERKTITFPADATGALNNDNAAALQVRFWLAVGSNFSSGTLATSWAAYTAANGAVGQTNVTAAINNYWQITGVQLETGPVDTTFEFKPYAEDLRQCQRYYYKMVNPPCHGVATGASTFGRFGMPHPVPMRAAPSATIIGTIDWYDGSTPGTLTTITAEYHSEYVLEFDASVATGTTAATRPVLFYNGTNDGAVSVSADL